MHYNISTIIKVPFTRYLREQNKEKTILVILNKVYSSLANHKHLLEVLIRVLMEPVNILNKL
jgi:hypothetical protein